MARGDSEVVEILVSGGADVNVKDEFGRTPLHRAVVAGNVEIVKLLVSKGADVNSKAVYFLEGDWVSVTPLERAMAANNTIIVECLTGSK